MGVCECGGPGLVKDWWRGGVQVWVWVAHGCGARRGVEVDWDASSCVAWGAADVDVGRVGRRAGAAGADGGLSVGPRSAYQHILLYTNMIAHLWTF